MSLKSAQQALRRAREDLERCVQQWTASLQKTHARLGAESANGDELGDNSTRLRRWGQLAPLQGAFLMTFIINNSKEKMKKRITFRLHAPGAKSVHLAGTFNGRNTRSYPLRHDLNGTWPGAFHPGSGVYIPFTKTIIMKHAGLRTKGHLLSGSREPVLQIKDQGPQFKRR